ncbi:MAG: hypothetical protein CL949_00785 [Erythrobacter sp.]|nr:hypothetical protein [Erythrobacter sp.]
MRSTPCDGQTAATASAEDRYDALDSFAHDLTKAARNGKLDPVIGGTRRTAGSSRFVILPRFAKRGRV